MIVCNLFCFVSNMNVDLNEQCWPNAYRGFIPISYKGMRNTVWTKRKKVEKNHAKVVKKLKKKNSRI